MRLVYTIFALDMPDDDSVDAAAVLAEWFTEIADEHQNALPLLNCAIMEHCPNGDDVADCIVMALDLNPTNDDDKTFNVKN